jgi:hypothetical protein
MIDDDVDWNLRLDGGRVLARLGDGVARPAPIRRFRTLSISCASVAASLRRLRADWRARFSTITRSE